MKSGFRVFKSFFLDEGHTWVSRFFPKIFFESLEIKGSGSSYCSSFSSGQFGLVLKLGRIFRQAMSGVGRRLKEVRRKPFSISEYTYMLILLLCDESL